MREITNNDNNFKIVGTVVEVKVEEITETKSGKEAISVNLVVKSDLDGVDNLFPLRFYARRYTAKNEVSKLYTSYSNLVGSENKKVEITGQIHENRYFNKTTGQMVSRQDLNGKFVKFVPDNTPDTAIFSVIGFVYKGITERTRKDASIYAYELTVAQANYNSSNMEILKFQVEPESKKIIQAIEANYLKGLTVSFHGDIRFITETVKVQSEAAFGDPDVKIYTNTTRNFFITGGSSPIYEDKIAYTADEIANLDAAYKANDVQLMSNVKEEVTSGSAVVTEKPRFSSNMQTLI